MKALPQLKDGLTEIYFHPGRDDDPVLRQYQTGYDHAAESAALLNPRLLHLIQELGVRLEGFETKMELSAAQLEVTAGRSNWSVNGPTASDVDRLTP